MNTEDVKAGLLLSLAEASTRELEITEANDRRRKALSEEEKGLKLARLEIVRAIIDLDNPPAQMSI